MKHSRTRLKPLKPFYFLFVFYWLKLGTESELSRSSARSSKESRKTKDKSKSPARSGDLNFNDTQADGENFHPGQTVFLADIKTAIEEWVLHYVNKICTVTKLFALKILTRFNEVWRNKDESGNPSQSQYDDMIYNEKYLEIELDFRRTVDELMRQELELLQVHKKYILFQKPVTFF